MSAPDILRHLAPLRAVTQPWIRAGKRIGVVPTMGALHDGHLSLVEAACAQCDHVIVTIFVNPKQFNSEEDLKNYPRTEKDDAEKLKRFNVDVVYAPEGDQIYGPDFSTTVCVAGLSDVMDGVYRPGHFDGVATVVTKLFTQTSATDAFFGEKDFQQLQIVRRLASDLDIPIAIHGCPTIREMDGLAMSSRNLLLSDRMRSFAPRLYEEMKTLAEALRSGVDFETSHAEAISRLQASGFGEIDYLDLRAYDDLSRLKTPRKGSRLFAAAWLGGVRLIDNIEVA